MWVQVGKKQFINLRLAYAIEKVKDKDRYLVQFHNDSYEVNRKHSPKAYEAIEELLKQAEEPDTTPG